MRRKTAIGVVLTLALVLSTGLLGSSAGCNCSETCGPGCEWIRTGNGDCTQHYYHRCQGSGCGVYNPFTDDCVFYCEWENWWSLLCGDCEHIVAYSEGCLQ